ncbi:MAG TPA: sugar ABC transporter permease [Candidatus Methylacidiphilales bacterium]
MNISPSLRRGATPWLFLAPFLVLLALFTLYPLGQAVILATEQTFGLASHRFVGFGNFAALARDPLFWRALGNTALYAVLALAVQLPAALGLALALNRPDVRGRAFLRLVFFSPSLFGVVFVAMLFSIIFEPYTGLLNSSLHRLVGFPLDFPWLREHTMAALVLCSLWMYAGFNMIFFLAALQGIDPALNEAARIDGANAWQRLVHVTLPQIAPVTGFVVLLSLIGSFQLFELPYILLGGGGPENRGLTVVMYLYQAGFEMGDLGYASAIGWVLAAILVVLALLQRRWSSGDAS